MPKIHTVVHPPRKKQYACYVPKLLACANILVVKNACSLIVHQQKPLIIHMFAISLAPHLTDHEGIQNYLINFRIKSTI